MKTAVILSYKGLGANLLHLTYCHEIAKKFGPITIITLCKNLEEVLSKDPLIKKIIYLDKYYKKFLDIFNLSNFLKKLQLENIFIFYPSFRYFIASKIAKINSMLQRTEYLIRKNSEQHREILERFLLNLAKIIK